MRIVCVSDTHSRHAGIRLPEGDVLVHAGDLTTRGTRAQIEEVDRWLGTTPYRHRVVIAGNHDFAFEQEPDARRWITQALYLEDAEARVAGLRVYGSPWQPRFFDWAFNLDRGEPLRRVWDKIPTGLDVLITHGPPRGILDRTARGDDAGCDDLREAVIGRARPRLHVFGHIHEAYGQVARDGIRFVNASTCTLAYAPTQPPIVVELS